MGIHAPVGGDDDRPIVRHTAVKPVEERVPRWLPGAFGSRTHDVPGHRDGAAPDQHMDGPDGAALTKGRGVQRQGAAPAIGQVQRPDPAQQGRETGRHVQTAPPVAAFGARFRLGIALPVAESLAHRLLAAAQHRGTEHRDLRQTTAPVRHDAETPQAAHDDLWSAPMRQVG
ncbi:MAG: hypothetical protein ACUVWS_18980 [Roseiflexus sp.]